MLIRINSSRIQVLKLSDEIETLNSVKETTVKHVLREMADDEWVVLKRSIKATADFVKKDVVYNKMSLSLNKKRKANEHFNLFK
jgi:hypothetical protein